MIGTHQRCKICYLNIPKTYRAIAANLRCVVDVHMKDESLLEWELKLESRQF
ncbi:hypothetical protein [aff. Roholtiella sp. LEGE 12411]|uniref:hypothetical protein n=1 Tax=aff. Roholtiella sp. LEGE 12411 TaxID=1828822 RepID=UPI001881E771|nr:hypothetical protein [aff. Roholtiella sp. LEGE 12411]MBE9036727.1 hypothetical protein [aff. Roholtiella sp. LEGE 12411]